MSVNRIYYPILLKIFQKISTGFLNACLIKNSIYHNGALNINTFQNKFLKLKEFSISTSVASGGCKLILNTGSPFVVLVVGTTFNWGSPLICALKAFTELTLLIRFNLVINKYVINLI